ncbi:FAD/FMN-containing dehydrogenase [Actinokineospora baliensis]|uniref:FAD-dependent oxidoreductase n=1 Tax=Actinokineospora baliensis TaxID=547056 RepID=UPI00195C72A0|nr:FAD-binding oxidoreductase [Actinokineospora baliensis]MBM7774567.1 FAD/FMN-containing dehydrogenase [Actinokineospora baliensis]
MPSRRDFLRLGVGTGAIAAVGTLGTLPSSAAPGGGRTNWDSLRRALSGSLVLPTDTGYDFARQLAVQEYDAVRPRAVAYCASARDVQTVIKFAQDNRLPAVPRSGGHSFGGYSTSPGIVLDVSRLNRVEVTGATVRIGPGSQQVDVLNTLAPRGLSMVGGTCATVCAGGFIQGGGIGFQTRKFGLAVDRLVSATVVLADGRHVRASAAENTDLFWALRGNGGGNYGVVTGYEVAPTDVRRMVNFNIVFEWEHAKRVIAAFQPWAYESSNDLAASATIINEDAGSGNPPIVAIGGAWHGTVAELDVLLDQLVADAGVQPVFRAATDKSYFDAMMEWYGCGEFTVDQCHRIGYSPEAQLSRMPYNRMRNRMFAGYVPEANIDRMLAALVADGRAGQTRLIYLDTFGGKANEPARTATAFVHRTSKMLAGFVCGLNDPAATTEDTQAATAWLASAFPTLEPGSQGESYQNFFDPALPDWRRSYYAENYDRLARIKRKYDPHQFFRFARAIG